MEGLEAGLSVAAAVPLSLSRIMEDVKVSVT